MLDSESCYGKETILVVDDAEPIRKMVCAMLAQSGYRCLQAGSGGDALEALREEAVHLLLTDVLMPGMGGAELATYVARQRPDMRIVFMSGYADDPVVRHVQSRPTLFLPKPFTAGALMTKIRQVLDQPWEGLQFEIR